MHVFVNYEERTNKRMIREELLKVRLDMLYWIVEQSSAGWAVVPAQRWKTQPGGRVNGPTDGWARRTDKGQTDIFLMYRNSKNFGRGTWETLFLLFSFWVSFFTFHYCFCCLCLACCCCWCCCYTPPSRCLLLLVEISSSISMYGCLAKHWGKFCIDSSNKVVRYYNVFFSCSLD